MTISIQKIIQKSLQIDNNQHKDNPFEKTHDLLKLIEYCQDIDQSFSILVRDCIKLNPYSIITRYPSELELIENDALSAIESAKNIREHVKKSIKD